MVTLIHDDNVHLFPDTDDAQSYLAGLAYELALEGWRDLELVEGALYVAGVTVAEWFDDSPDQVYHTGVYDLDMGEEITE